MREREVRILKQAIERGVTLYEETWERLADSLPPGMAALPVESAVYGNDASAIRVSAHHVDGAGGRAWRSRELTALLQVGRVANTITVDRENWLGYRWRGQCLDGSSGNDDLLVLGLQGSRQSHGEQALSQRASRIGSTTVAKAIAPDGPLVCLWSVRGAPHAHRAEQLDFVRDALTTLDSDDGGTKFVEALDEVAAALKKIVRAGPRKTTPAGRSPTPSTARWCSAASGVTPTTFRMACSGRLGARHRS